MGMTAANYMREAIREAEKAAIVGEIPVGAVVVHRGEILCRAQNRKERDHDPVGHAEILGLREAARQLGDWRLEDCSLYVTLEPCAMCAAAMVQARLGRLVFGTYDPQFGGVSGELTLLSGRLGWSCECLGGLLEKECSALLKKHFQQAREGERRNAKKAD